MLFLLGHQVPQRAPHDVTSYGGTVQRCLACRWISPCVCTALCRKHCREMRSVCAHLSTCSIQLLLVIRCHSCAVDRIRVGNLVRWEHWLTRRMWIAYYAGSHVQDKKGDVFTMDFFAWRMGNRAGSFGARPGVEYEGDWSADVDGVYHGHGVATLSGGEIYRGAWRNGVMHGNGMYRYCSGALLEGVFANNKPEGPGRLLVNGGAMEGTWKDGLREGVFVVALVIDLCNGGMHAGKMEEISLDAAARAFVEITESRKRREITASCDELIQTIEAELHRHSESIGRREYDR